MEPYSTAPDADDDIASDKMGELLDCKIPAYCIDWGKMPWPGCWRLFLVQYLSTTAALGITLLVLYLAGITLGAR